jgi:hexosaminidase
MMFPRLIALAERAWHKDVFENTTIQPDREYEKFANKVGYREMPRLDNAGVKYRIPPPGVA